ELLALCFQLRKAKSKAPSSALRAPSPASGRRDTAYFSIRNSSTCRPSAVRAASQRGWRPRPVQLSSGLSGLRYFGGTLPSLRAFLATRPVLRGAVAPVVPNSSSTV